MSECKNCGHLVWDIDGKWYHYQTVKGMDIADKCWDCSCEKPEEKDK